MKKFRWDKKYLYWGVTAFCVIAASIIFYLLVSNISGFTGTVGKFITILSPFIWGLVISYLLCPLTNILDKSVFLPLFNRIANKTPTVANRRSKLANGFAVLFSIIALLALLAAFIWMVIPQLYLSIESIIANSAGYVQKVYEWLDTLVLEPELEAMLGTSFGSASSFVIDIVEDHIMPRLDGLVAGLTSGVFTVVKGVYNILIGMIVAVYVLYNRVTFGAHMKKIVYCIFSVEASEKIIAAVNFADRVFNGFLSGKILDSAIIGIICYAFCVIVKMPYAVLISVIVGVTNVIPFFGPFIGAIPSALIVFMESPLMCLVFVIFVILLQQFDGNFLGPKILGNSVGINGFWIMFSIIVGSGLFGFMGMLLGVPVFVLIYTFFTNVVNRKLQRSGLPNETDVYSNMSHIDPDTGEIVAHDHEEAIPSRKSGFGGLFKRKNKAKGDNKKEE